MPATAGDTPRPTPTRTAWHRLACRPHLRRLSSQKDLLGVEQAGCNWQYNVAVFGFETDFQGASQKASRFSSVPFNIFEGPSGNATQHVEARLRWFGTVRARAGVLVVPTVLLYGTGGLAYGNVKVTDTITVDGYG